MIANGHFNLCAGVHEMVSPGYVFSIVDDIIFSHLILDSPWHYFLALQSMQAS